VEALIRWQHEIRGQVPPGQFIPLAEETGLIIIRRTGVDPQLLTLEITEGTLIEDLDDTIAKLKALKELGLRISVDDFGTGYSSLYYLKHLPLDELKIDRAYVQDITEDPNDAAIVETILSMSRHPGPGRIPPRTRQYLRREAETAGT